MICDPRIEGKSIIVDILRNVFQKFKNVDKMVSYLINPKDQIIPRLYVKKNEFYNDFEIPMPLFQIINLK